MRDFRILGSLALLLPVVLGSFVEAAPVIHGDVRFSSPLSSMRLVAVRPTRASMIWLVISSRLTYAEASEVAQTFASTLGPTLIVRSSNGRYAIAAGTLFKDKAKPNLETLKALRLIPQDAFLSSGDSFDQLVSHTYGTNASTDLMTQSALINSVRRLQMAFTKLKLYSGATDGLVGPATIDAFNAYAASFSLPPDEYLNEYALGAIEESAQDGFHSAAERQAARSMGFENALAYAEATRGGFTSLAAFQAAKQRGFQTQRELDDASNAGFQTAEEFRKARAGGFETSDEYRSALEWQISTRDEYRAFKTSGFADTESFFKARARGIADKSTYDRILKSELDAARRKADVLLDDVKTFIRLNPNIPNLVEIAEKVATLALARADEMAQPIDQASRELLALLTPLPGYSEFADARERERAEDHNNKIVGLQKELADIRTALTKWVAANIASPKLPLVVKEIKHLSEAIPLDDLDRLQEAKSKVDALISKNGLSKEVFQVAGVAASSAASEETAPFPVTPANAVLLSGPREDVVALYNASSGAPSLVRTLNGEFSFTRQTAVVCMFGIEATPSVKRGLRDVLEPLGATKIKAAACNDRSPEKADILLIARKAFLEAKPSLAISFIDALEAKKLRIFDAIAYNKIASRQSEEADLVAHIAAGIEANSRKGYGAIELPASDGGLCVTIAGDVDIHKDFLREVSALVEEPRFAAVKNQTLEDLYPEILHDKCRVYYGSATSLHQLSQAMKRDERSFAFLPVWIDDKAVEQAVAKKASAEQEKIKQAASEKLAAEEQARIEAVRREKELASLSVVQAELQKTNGPAAAARLVKFTESLKAALPGAPSRQLPSQPTIDLYPSLSSWLNERLKEGWELVNVDTGVHDFGSVLWKERRLDALVASASLKMKNAELGEYRTECFLLGIVLDDEFDKLRDPIDSLCEDERSKVNAWKVGHSFASRWLAAASAVPQ